MAISSLERTVILLAARPGERAVPKQRLARCWRWLFGLPAPKPLACPRLEAFRKYAACVHAAPASDVPDDVTALCRESGWSRDDLDQVVAFIRDPDPADVGHGPPSTPIATASPSRPRPSRSRPVPRPNQRPMSSFPARLAEQAV